MPFKDRIKNLIKGADKFSPRPFFYSFVMTEGERKLFDTTVAGAKVYLEFGMGGSTFRVLLRSKAKVYSIDSSLEWIDVIRQYYLIRSTEGKRLELIHVDIGNTREWGLPDGESSYELFPSYSSSIFDHVDSSAIDTVLVDGRFRVACTLMTILECSGNDDLKIMIHDFWRRKKYHIVLEYLDVVTKVDNLGVFKVKDDVDFDAVKANYDIFKYVPL